MKKIESIKEYKKLKEKQFILVKHKKENWVWLCPINLSETNNRGSLNRGSLGYWFGDKKVRALGEEDNNLWLLSYSNGNSLKKSFSEWNVFLLDEKEIEEYKNKLVLSVL